MLNFNPDNYLSVQNGAVALAGPIDEVIRKELDAGMRNIAFWG